ncbi:MAG: CoA pyrophosphatase [bacterium]|nr:MAG: CoA pyrophosphatase [bacterium]
MANHKMTEYNFQQAVERTRKVLDKYDPRQLSVHSVLPAAVMILFVERRDFPHLIFTKRTDTVETHKGQISFPGGVKDLQDENLLDTATRETFEEVGIQPERINILGQLDDFFTVTDFVVTPFAGYIDTEFQYKINTREVAQILEVPLSVFLQDNDFEIKKWEHQGATYDVFFYHYQNQIIWGATAYILNRFIDTVFGYNPAPHAVIRDPRNDHYLRENLNRRSNK